MNLIWHFSHFLCIRFRVNISSSYLKTFSYINFQVRRDKSSAEFPRHFWAHILRSCVRLCYKMFPWRENFASLIVFLVCYKRDLSKFEFMGFIFMALMINVCCFLQQMNCKWTNEQQFLKNYGVSCKKGRERLLKVLEISSHQMIYKFPHNVKSLKFFTELFKNVFFGSCKNSCRLLY